MTERTKQLGRIRAVRGTLHKAAKARELQSARDAAALGQVAHRLETLCAQLADLDDWTDGAMIAANCEMKQRLARAQAALLEPICQAQNISAAHRATTILAHQEYRSAEIAHEHAINNDTIVAGIRRDANTPRGIRKRSDGGLK